MYNAVDLRHKITEILTLHACTALNPFLILIGTRSATVSGAIIV